MFHILFSACVALLLQEKRVSSVIEHGHKLHYEFAVVFMPMPCREPGFADNKLEQKFMSGQCSRLGCDDEERPKC